MVTVVSAMMKSGFPVEYATADSISVLATVFALNFATATFLIGSLLNIEEKVGRNVFDEPRKEIKQNLYAMAGLLGLNVLVVSLIDKSRIIHIFHTQITLNDILGMLVLAILFFYIALLIEVINGALNIRNPKK
ncbi:MAG: hypothetical protein JWN38_779 [Candidatus Saccharibacteria bacterium]|nr:hypothetical protein [Candidatus Saccharibacteria bacterium]